MTNEELMYSSPEDQDFYLKCVEGLPTLAGLSGDGFGSDGQKLPYGLGPHSVKCLREIIEIVNPTKIFEIGFNMGWSSSLWLGLTEADVHSCDISYKNETLQAAHILLERYPERFHYNHISELFFDTFMYSDYTLGFIDGDHTIEGVQKDINTAILWNIPYLAFDDILPQFGEVQKAIDMYLDEIELVKEMGNIALYKRKAV